MFEDNYFRSYKADER